MIKKTITYTDFNGDQITEDFYFNLTKAELVELELSANQTGGFGESLKAIAESNDGAKIIETFKDILRRSYGVRSEDGKRFIKSVQLWEEFEQTEAYSELFVELATNATYGAEFVRGVLPASFSGEQAATTISSRPATSDYLKKQAPEPKTEVIPDTGAIVPKQEVDLRETLRAQIEKEVRDEIAQNGGDFGQRHAQ